MGVGEGVTVGDGVCVGTGVYDGVGVKVALGTGVVVSVAFTCDGFIETDCVGEATGVTVGVPGPGVGVGDPGRGLALGTTVPVIETGGVELGETELLGFAVGTLVTDRPGLAEGAVFDKAIRATDTGGRINVTESCPLVTCKLDSVNAVLVK